MVIQTISPVEIMFLLSLVQQLFPHWRDVQNLNLKI